jgi:hypothetical protein
MEWSKEKYLEVFDTMDKVGKPKDKYMLLNGFMKGIVFSSDSDKEKLDDLQALSDAFDESLHRELIKYNDAKQNKLLEPKSGSRTIITNKETDETYTFEH